jgi:outer membrane biosynthesis protein TonB
VRGGIPAYTTKEVTKRAELLDKPEPIFTEEAIANHTTGTVRLQLVFCPDGHVEHVTPITRLPDGLTERAIEAAHKLKFKPAERRGRKVAQLATIDYNFEP